MAHRSTFTRNEIDRLHDLIQEKQNTFGKEGQKRIRDRMRSLGFYISDYPGSRDFGVADFNQLLRAGLIKVKDQESGHSMLSKEENSESNDISWEWCQENSDMLLSCGINQLLEGDKHRWSEVHTDGPGVYLFSEEKKHLYIGESLIIGNRVHQHCEGGTRSTFLKNFADHLGVAKESDSIAELLNEVKSTIDIQALWVDIGRKELEEFGIVNLPTILNRFHKGKRRKVTFNCKDESIWDTVQDFAIELIEQGTDVFENLPQSKWLQAKPSDKAGLYKVLHEGELIYIGESTNIAERYKAHSNTTYFSALRRSVGTKLFDFEYIGKKKFMDSDDNKITNFLLDCDYASIPIGFGRRELEEYLIRDLQPTLNSKSK
jgi:predicted GIY-YIG superfamily endonuclease